MNSLGIKTLSMSGSQQYNKIANNSSNFGLLPKHDAIQVGASAAAVFEK